jgi:hypothetical protein
LLPPPIELNLLQSPHVPLWHHCRVHQARRIASCFSPRALGGGLRDEMPDALLVVPCVKFPSTLIDRPDHDEQKDVGRRDARHLDHLQRLGSLNLLQVRRIGSIGPRSRFFSEIGGRPLTGAFEPGKADSGAFIGMALIHSAAAGGSVLVGQLSRVSSVLFPAIEGMGLGREVEEDLVRGPSDIGIGIC